MKGFDQYSEEERALYNTGFNHGMFMDKRLREKESVMMALKEEYEKGPHMPPYSKGVFDGLVENEKLEDFFLEVRAREAKDRYEDFEPDF